MSTPSPSRFQLLRKLGEGGMGIVYEAYDRVRKKRIALKKLRNDHRADNILRFKREFRALRDISHQNIIALYELVAEDGQWYLTMEVIDGRDFVSALRGERLTVRGVSTTSKCTLDDKEGGGGDTGPTPPFLRSQRVLPRGLPRPPGERHSLLDKVDIARVLSALRQLARALVVLHSVGTIHRDLKPSNVLVTAAGRVVLMDFGIVSESAPDGRRDERGMAVGTPGFMAPEQARGAPATAATDWYAFGVMMYAALVGSLPFTGTETAVLRAKQRFAPLAPSEFARDIPPGLEQLCIDLLARDPAARPRGQEILARLGMDEVSAAPLNGPTRSTWNDEALVGRKSELAALHAAWRQTQGGGSRCILISGPLGIGKSSLLERFATEIRAAERPPLVFHGRCHERESVHYKALDSIIDQLSCYLADLSESRLGDLVSEPPLALLQVFPILRRVALWSDARPPSGSPHAVRERALQSLRALLARLAEERPVVLCIDDLQWAGGDSLELLLDILWPPAPAGLLVLTTLCSDTSADDPTLRHHVASIEELAVTERVPLGPLSASEQRALAQAMSRHVPEGHRLLDEIHERAWIAADGHPMLLVEIARHAVESANRPIWRSRGRLSLELEDIIRERVACLPVNEKILLQLIAVAGEPMPMRLLADAGTMSLADVERAASFLRINHLVRVSPSADEPWLDSYHLRIRRAILDQLPETRVRALHTKLACALERWRTPPAAVTGRQWLLAGNLKRAAGYLMSAATDAADSLAFEHAARLHAIARDLELELDTDRELAPEPQADGETSAGDKISTTDVSHFEAIMKP